MRAPQPHLLRLLFSLARSLAMGFLVGLGFSYAAFALPAQRLRETASLVAFYHPRPAHQVHILIVAKRRLQDMTSLGAGDVAFMQDLFLVVRELVAELGLAEGGYRLIGNGGHYQEVKHLHFHLVADGGPVTS